jgi:hypothetical protein
MRTALGPGAIRPAVARFRRRIARPATSLHISDASNPDVRDHEHGGLHEADAGAVGQDTPDLPIYAAHHVTKRSAR